MGRDLKENKLLMHIGWKFIDCGTTFFPSFGEITANDKLNLNDLLTVLQSIMMLFESQKFSRDDYYVFYWFTVPFSTIFKLYRGWYSVLFYKATHSFCEI